MQGVTYLAGHMSLPSGVVTISHNSVITSTPTLLLYDSIRAWHGNVAEYCIEYYILLYGVCWSQGMSIKEYQSEWTVTVSYSLVRLFMDKCVMVVKHVVQGLV